MNAYVERNEPGHSGRVVAPFQTDDEMRAVLARVAGWQDIASAPKDGTTVDLWIVTRVVENGGKLKDRGRRIANAKWCHRSLPFYGPVMEAGWRVGDDPVEVITPGGRTYATHWMPLPAPPEPGK